MMVIGGAMLKSVDFWLHGVVTFLSNAYAENERASKAESGFLGFQWSKLPH